MLSSLWPLQHLCTLLQTPSLTLPSQGLADYLETKRVAFARFFFLSNDELLQILSQTKNPLAVQPHLRKCFEAIESLDFADNLEISAMNSKEKEKVPFDKPMFPQGNVEVWLGEVENRMRNSVRHQVIESMAAYVAQPRPDWVREWPAMVVLAVSAIFWAKEAEDAINGSAMDTYFQKCNQDLLDLTDLVRGKLSGQDRLTLGALITIDVHSRDVVQVGCSYFVFPGVLCMCVLYITCPLHTVATVPMQLLNRYSTAPLASSHHFATTICTQDSALLTLSI